MLVLDIGQKSPYFGEMLGTELAYVRARLEPLNAAQRKAVADACELNVKTINRLVSKATKYGRTDTIGKIAMHFRTREKRATARQAPR